MRFLILPLSLLLFGCAAAEQSKPTYSLEEQAMVIDDVCLVETKAEEETVADYEDEEIFITATAAPEEGEQFALSIGNEIEDTLRSLRKKEAFIDRKARFLGYDGK